MTKTLFLGVASVGFSIIILFYLTPREILTPRDLWLNIGTSLGGVGFTVLVVDQIYRREADKTERIRLLRELGSSDNATALKAARELEARNWASTKHLRRINLIGANLDNVSLPLPSFEGACLDRVTMRNSRFLILDLRNACLFRADLSNSNIGLFVRLEGAMLTEANMCGAIGITEDELRKAHSLWGATLPDGSQYRGQYELQGDLEVAARHGVDIQDPHALTHWYEYTPERSQWWVNEVLVWTAVFSSKQTGWRHKLEMWMYGFREGPRG